MRGIRSALIVGAGAIGAAVASLLYDANPDAVALCATGARRERYLRDGFIINDKRYAFRLADPQADAPYDLIIVSVKSDALSGAIEDMRPYVGPDTTILSLLNGISSEEILRAEFGAGKVPLAIIIAIDALRVGNAVTFKSQGEIQFGYEKDFGEASGDRTALVSRFFTAHNILHEISPDMTKVLWYKFMLNVALNQWSAILRGPYALFQESVSARELLSATMKEVIALSEALGKGLVLKDIDRVFATLDKLNGKGRTSMLQDVDAGRKTEVGAFAGVVVEKARECGVSAPINQFLLLAIKAIEDGFGQ
ncbi:MAG TPA: ketopantoate reductase family protein [Rectinemataceae bacterium]|nr:ketopantoate reductase family protein [Rectinemataceae bacterium]